jgi:hypothetical protein
MEKLWKVFHSCSEATHGPNPILWLWHSTIVARVIGAHLRSLATSVPPAMLGSPRLVHVRPGASIRRSREHHSIAPLPCPDLLIPLVCSKTPENLAKTQNQPWPDRWNHSAGEPSPKVRSAPVASSDLDPLIESDRVPVGRGTTSN